MSYTEISDAQWVRSSFLLPRYATDADDKRSKIFSSAFLKFTDSTLGGNFCINPPPQHTVFADLPIRNPVATMSSGSGRIFSEKYDDSFQTIHMRAGVPAFNGLAPFLSGFYDYESATLSKTGRAPSFLYSIGKVAGFVVTLPLQPFILAGRLIRFFTSANNSRFYYMKPTMPIFWQAATTMLNTIQVFEGSIPKVLATSANAEKPGAESGLTRETPDEERAAANDRYLSGDILEDELVATKDDFKIYHELLPEIFREDGGIDLYAVANRAQRKATRVRKDMMKVLEVAKSTGDLTQAAIDFINKSNTGVYDKDPGLEHKGGLSAYLAAWNSLPIGTPSSTGTATTETLDTEDKNWGNSIFDFFDAELKDGGQFVTFRVNETGSVSESFSNQTGTPEIKNKINGMSASARSKSFDFAAGNLGDGAISNAIESVFGAVKDLTMGVLDGVGLGGLAAAFGSAYIDVPDRWEDSVANAPTMSYTMELRTPYNNPVSRLMNLNVPLALILTFALPKAAGKAAYDSPFLIELYDKGKAQTRLGIIDSLTIERGVGNVGWTRDGRATAINVTFTVKELSNAIYMPIAASPGLFDEQSSFTDYMAVLGSMGLTDQIYATNLLKLNLTRKMTEWKTWNSPAKWGAWMADSTPGRLISAFSKVTDRK